MVVTTYNRAARLSQTLEPLMADPAPRELIVAIDGSRDGSLELVQSLARRDPRLRPVFIENSGDMAARAAGARAATGDVVLFLDDDVIAEPGLVAGHARRHARGDIDAVVGYMPISLPPQRGPGEVATRLYAQEYEGRCAIYEREPASALRELWGGNFSIRRDACLGVGMSNPDFTEPYHADREFGLRAWKAGLRPAFDRSLRATHRHTRTLSAFRRDARSQGAARVLLQRAHAEVVEPLVPGAFEQNLPGAARRLVRFGRRPRGYALLSRALSQFVLAAGRLRSWPAEDLGAKLLRRIEQQRGAIDGSLGRRPRT